MGVRQVEAVCRDPVDETQYCGSGDGSPWSLISSRVHVSPGDSDLPSTSGTSLRAWTTPRLRK